MLNTTRYEGLIPESTLETLDLFARYAMPPGGFVSAVLSNDLMEAFGRADEHNIAAMRHICSFVYNEMPSECWGNPAKVRAWRGLQPVGVDL